MIFLPFVVSFLHPVKGDDFSVLSLLGNDVLRRGSEMFVDSDSALVPMGGEVTYFANNSIFLRDNQSTWRTHHLQIRIVKFFPYRDHKLSAVKAFMQRTPAHFLPFGLLQHQKCQKANSIDQKRMVGFALRMLLWRTRPWPT